ncbi:MAG TPA: hypothetical protein VF691_20090 [Cytophagaceae bacterium]
MKTSQLFVEDISTLDLSLSNTIPMRIFSILPIKFWIIIDFLIKVEDDVNARRKIIRE